jgi:hypothetical protein
MENNTFQKFNPEVWGPHYWFFLHTLAFSYPSSPNAVTKRKYYDLIQNFPLFLPVPEIGNYFSQLLDKHPVSPYLDSRESFIRWTHFIHNKLNAHLGKEEISLYESIDRYYMNYKTAPIKISDKINMKKHYIFSALIMVLVLLIYIFYK